MFKYHRADTGTEGTCFAGEQAASEVHAGAGETGWVKCTGGSGNVAWTLWMCFEVLFVRLAAPVSIGRARVRMGGRGAALGDRIRL